MKNSTKVDEFFLMFDEEGNEFYLQPKGGKFINWVDNSNEKFTPENVGKLFFVEYTGDDDPLGRIHVESMIEIEE